MHQVTDPLGSSSAICRARQVNAAGMLSAVSARPGCVLIV